MGIFFDDSSRALSLEWMVQVNEEIKRVTNLSFGVNLVALNAMLVSKSAGERSRGFGVVSSELRMFSGKLREAMGGLGVRIFDLVNDVAAMQKQSHERGHLLRAMEQGGELREFMGAPLARKEDALLQLVQSMEKERDHLLRQVRRTLQLCDMGTSLARSAKIESVYGGEMSATLKQVAGQIEGTIEEILGILNTLESRLVA
jgi:methyl-accepting chemotaxis protein